MWWIKTDVSYDITLWFNRLGEGRFGSFLGLFSLLGSEIFLILLIPLIFWCINKSIGKRILIVTLLSAYVGVLLQNLWLKPRPFNRYIEGKDEIINRLSIGDSYGFPSAYMMIITSLWIYIATISKKVSTQLLCYLAVIFVAISRMVSGVNFIHSIVMGILIAVLVLLLFKVLEPKITETCNQRYTVKQRIMLILFFTVGAVIILIFSGIEDIKLALTFVSCFFGATIGIVLEKEYLDFKVDGPLVLRIGRYILGLALISIIYYGVDVVLNLWNVNSNIVLFFKYGLLSFITAYPIPKIFVVMNLCSTAYKRDSLN